jgi:hypothetical protein
MDDEAPADIVTDDGATPDIADEDVLR